MMAGEIFFHGVQGATASRFRRGTSLRVGPLTLDRPLFLEASFDGALRSGLPYEDRVAGANTHLQPTRYAWFSLPRSSLIPLRGS
jgi:hypothetical protein